VRLAGSLLTLLLLAPAVASADVLTLCNGRRMEGKIVEQTPSKIRIRIPGGTFEVPTRQVKKIERSENRLAELAEVASKTDMEDAAAIERLARVAREKGLRKQAKEIEGIARDVRLQQRVAEARRKGRARDFVSVFQWARSQNESDEVQDWLIGLARQIDPADPHVEMALETRRRDLEARAQRAARIQQLRSQPSYKMPEGVHLEDGPKQALRCGVLEAVVAKQQRRIRQLEQRLGERPAEGSVSISKSTR